MRGQYARVLCARSREYNVKPPPAQGNLFAPTPAVVPPVHPKTKCRRSGCGHTYRHHYGTGCHDYAGFCLCDGFVAAPEKTPRKEASASESAYREAYERGIRRASSMPFAVLGQRVGSVLGVVARTHAPTLTGPAALVWIEDQAFAFRNATDAAPQYWSAWQPFAFAKWIGMGGTAVKVTPKPQGASLQPLGKRR